jgi:hypothetical protein
MASGDLTRKMTRRHEHDIVHPASRSFPSMTLGTRLHELRVRLRSRRRIARLGQRFRLPLPEIRFSRMPTPFDADCAFERVSGRYIVTFIGSRIDYISGYNKIPAALYWFSLCPPAITAIRVNLSDGEVPSAARFSFSTNLSDVVPLPDRDFFSTRGFEDIRNFATANGVDWSRRSDRVRWRGQTNGPGGIDYSGSDALWDQSLLPRLRMVLILRNAEATDVAFAGSYRRELATKLRSDGLIAARIPETDWINDKFALDIDGATNTWTNFLVRMHLGCCVIKVDSQYGYRQWYYDRIRPWEHFVPVRSDMSDLVEKIEWARSHDQEARAIAANGRAFARSMTFESETDYAIAAICAANGVSTI